MTNRKNDLPEEPFDPDSERPVDADELNFEDDEEQSFTDLSPTADASESGLLDDDDDTQASDINDNLEPEILIKEDGARSPHETAADIPADVDLTIVDIKDIGAGHGLDEAELAHVNPLDGKRQRALSQK